MSSLSFEQIQQKIQSLAERIFNAAGMDLIELKVNGNKNDVRIEITADKPSGGINIHECAILNKSLVAAIEQEQVLPPENFSLELSSPGLDRPLLTPKDFMRCKGMNLHFWLNEPVVVGGKKEVEGIITEVGTSDVTIATSAKAKLVLPIASIIKGLLVI